LKRRLVKPQPLDLEAVFLIEPLLAYNQGGQSRSPTRSDTDLDWF